MDEDGVCVGVPVREGVWELELVGICDSVPVLVAVSELVQLLV